MTTRTWKRIALALSASAVVWIVACENKGDPKPAPQPAGGGPKTAAGEPVGDGKAVYEANCAVCHGAAGKGDGTAAWLLWPRPRDFTQGKFKIRSTEGSGAVPTDDDLLATINNGMPGTAMPAWSFLPLADRKALVRRVKDLSQYQAPDMEAPLKFFQREEKGTPVVVSPETSDDETSRALGKAVYARLECARCHGATGKADGPSAATLRDDWGNPIRPNDFTQGIFRGGSTPRDIYLRFSTGMSGTPMPAFEMKDEEKWALVHYVRSLAGEAPKAMAAAVAPGSELAVTKVEALPKGPDDAAWDAIPASEVVLHLLFARAAAPRLLKIRAAHDGKEIAFQLSWADTTDSHAPLRAEDFRDAVALMFALKGMDTPVTMGSKDKPVNLWHWKADWQIDLERWQDVESIHPGMAVEMYPFEKDQKTVANHGSHPPAMPDQDPAYQSGRAAGNPMADPGRKSPVEDLSAAGFGTLTSNPKEKQQVAGKGLWKDGRWTVQMSRALAAPDDCCVALAPGKETPLAFAVWDGAAGDRAGQKSVTTWFRLVLK